MEGSGTLKKKVAAGFLLILLAVFLFNRCVLRVSSACLEDGELLLARITAQAAIPFDPFLYILSPEYSEHLSDIRTAESIRRFGLFHAMKSAKIPDIPHIDNHTYGAFSSYDFTTLWEMYTDLFSDNGTGSEKEVRAHERFCRNIGIQPAEAESSLYNQLVMYHIDYTRRLDERKVMFSNISFLIDRFEKNGSRCYVKDIINILRDFDMEFELRYGKKQPLYYVHSTLIRNTVLFQAYAIDFLNTNDRKKLVNAYTMTLKPIIREISGYFFRDSSR
jgi:hypothetical protein